MEHYVPPVDLYARYLEGREVCIDSRAVRPGSMFFALHGTTDGHQYAAAALEKGAAYAVIDDPAVRQAGDDRYLLVEDTLLALQQLARNHRQEYRMPVLAVTGSNGKTTTKELIAAVMGQQYRVHATPGNYNNHIGLPLTILSMPEGTEFLLLEMGANHQGEIAALCTIGAPTHGMITNIGEAHLEGFGGIEGVVKGKGELYDWLAAHGGVAFVNTDEERLPTMAQRVDRVIPYFNSTSPSPLVAGMEVLTHQIHPTVQVSFLDEHRALVRADTQLNGKHNLQNVKSAVAVGKYFKVPGTKIRTALEDYRSANYRSQRLLHREVNFYWDAYNANPSSVIAALEGFAAGRQPGELVVILGEMLELGPTAAAAHRRVVLRAGQLARTVLLVGEQMEAVAREFDRPYFADSEVLRQWFWQQHWKDREVFVKGSRGNHLERLLQDD